MSKQQEFLKKFSQKYGLTKEDFWKHKQSGQWILSHNAVIKAAAQEGIKFIIEKWEDSDQRKVVKVSAMRGEEHPVEMLGECRVGAKGITAEYCWSMALKRGEDRATLRILAAGGGLYSEIEAEVFSRNQNSSGMEEIAKRAKELEKE